MKRRRWWSFVCGLFYGNWGKGKSLRRKRKGSLWRFSAYLFVRKYVPFFYSFPFFNRERDERDSRFFRGCCGPFSLRKSLPLKRISINLYDRSSYHQVGTSHWSNEKNPIWDYLLRHSLSEERYLVGTCQPLIGEEWDIDSSDSN